MRKLTFGMNLTLDGYIAAPGDDIGWGVPSDELFQWWSDRVGATGLALYGRKLWETMSSHWPTADQQPGTTPVELEFARRWQDMPKVVFSSTISTVDWNTRLVVGDAVAEITRLKAEDGGSMDIGGATLAAAAMRAELIDEYVPGINQLVEKLVQAERAHDLHGALDALHSLVGMSGEAGAKALYVFSRETYIPMLERQAWPESPDWAARVREMRPR